MEKFDSDNKRKIKLANDVFLFFEDDGMGNYTFSSNNPELQEWCNQVKKKKVKEEAIKFVTNAARNFIRKPQQKAQELSAVNTQQREENGRPSRRLQTKKKSQAFVSRQPVDPNTIIKGNIKDFVSALNLYCQKTGTPMPEFINAGTIQSNGKAMTTIKLIDAEGHKETAHAATKQEAKQKAALAYCRNILKIKALSEEALLKQQKEEAEYEREQREIESYLRQESEANLKKYQKEYEEALKQQKTTQQTTGVFQRVQTETKPETEQENRKVQNAAYLESIKKIIQSATVTKEETENGRKYQIESKDTGHKYILTVAYNDEKRPGVNDRFQAITENLRTLRVTCDDLSAATPRQIKRTLSREVNTINNPYSLDALFLTNLKISGNLSNRPEKVQDALLLRELLQAANDQIVRAPKLIERYRKDPQAKNVELAPYTESLEHLQRHTSPDSVTVGSKALKNLTNEDFAKILQKFDNAYALLIDKQGNPGRQVMGLKTDSYAGSDAIIAAENLEKDAIFSLVREPNTRGETKIKVALIEEKDMPKTNVIHAVYGPYGPTGRNGIYTMMFGDPGEPFPRSLDENASEADVARNQKAEAYWNGENGSGGHVFLITPKELEASILAMKEAGKTTVIQEKRLKEFVLNPANPVIKHEPSQISAEAVNLGKVYLSSSSKINHAKGKSIV